MVKRGSAELGFCSQPLYHYFTLLYYFLSSSRAIDFDRRFLGSAWPVSRSRIPPRPNLLCEVHANKISHSSSSIKELFSSAGSIEKEIDRARQSMIFSRSGRRSQSRLTGLTLLASHTPI